MNKRVISFICNIHMLPNWLEYVFNSEIMKKI